GAQAFPVEPYFGDDQDANWSFREETHRITPRSRPSWPVATAKVTRSWIEYRRARESSPHQRAPSRTGGARTQERESTTSRLQKSCERLLQQRVASLRHFDATEDRRSRARSPLRQRGQERRRPGIRG